MSAAAGILSDCAIPNDDDLPNKIIHSSHEGDKPNVRVACLTTDVASEYITYIYS